MKKKILVAIKTTPEEQEKLKKAAPDCDFLFTTISSATQQQVSDANLIIGSVPPKFLHDVPNLEWIQVQSAGTDAYVHVLPNRVLLTNATGAYGLAVSEHILAMLLCMIKKLYLYRDHQTHGEWVDEGMVKTMEQARVLVVGLGDIGSHFAKKCKALGSYTVGLRRHIAEKPDYVDELYTMDSLDEELEKADVVAIFLPSAENTTRLFDKQRIAHMKSDAVLLNGGRGSIIDTQALCDALQTESIGGACLDVTDPEPLPSDHPLWTMKNVLITPHAAGSNHLAYTTHRIFEICYRNLQNYIQKKPLHNLIKHGEN